MQSWNNIIATAMLGIDKKQPERDELSEDLAAILTTIGDNATIDKEEQFLQLTAAVSNYRQCGVVPLHKSELPIDIAPAEELPYCNNASAQILKTILDEDNKSLLKLWLQLCTQKQQIAPSVLLPQLLDKAIKYKSLRQEIQQCAGNRGGWLSNFNKDWTFAPATGNDEELWQTGTADQRKDVLLRMRVIDPAQAHEWLQATWSKESANTKADLLTALAVNLSDADLDWLESLTTDKSQKVKDAAYTLLANIPSSSVVQRYWQVAQQAVTLKKEKKMLGLSFKMVLQAALPATYDDTIHKTGIEKTINNKSFTNEEWIVYQLISSVPPQLWEVYFNEPPEKILELLTQDKNNEKYIPAFAVATGRFMNTAWAQQLSKDESFHSDILLLLSAAEKEKYLLAHIDRLSDTIIDQLTTGDNEWSKEIAMAVFKRTANAPYQYNRSFYSQYIHLVPLSIAGELEKIVPKEEYQRSTWNNTSDHIVRLLSLKEQTIQSFK